MKNPRYPVLSLHAISLAFPPPWRFLRFLSVAAVGMALQGQIVRAAGNTTWNASPTDGNWVTSPGGENNWSAGAGNFPGSTSSTSNTNVGTFNSGSSTTGITVNSTSLNIGGIVFDGAAAAYTISGANALALSSGGSITLGSAATSFTGSNVTETINVPLTLEPGGPAATGSYSFVNNSTTTSNVLNLGGGITGGTTSLGITLTLGGANTGNNVISGVIGDGLATGKVNVVKSGLGTWALSGANTYSGGTTVNGGTLVLDLSTGSISSTGSLTLGGGNFTVLGNSSGSSAQTVGNLNITGGTGNELVINSNGGAGTTLTLGGTWVRGAGNLNSTLNINLSSPNSVLVSSPMLTNGVITGVTTSAGTTSSGRAFVTVTDSGGTGFGTVNGSGDVVRYTGATSISGTITGASLVGTTNYIATGNVSMTTNTGNVNTLQLASSSAPGVLDLGSRTLQLNGARALLMTGSQDYTVQNGILGASGAETIIHQYGTGTLTISATMGGTSTSVAKDGPGALVVAAANTYTGGTFLLGGKTLINNTTGSGTGTGVVNVASGATLGGNGTINPTGTNKVTIAAGGTLAPGTAGHTDALTISAAGNTAPGLLNLTGATLAFNLGAGNTSSSLNLTSSFLGEVAGLSGNTFNFTDLTSGSLTSGEYTLMISDASGGNNPFAGLTPGTLSGFTFTGLGSDTAQLELNQISGFYAIQLDLTAAVPEPSTWAMMIGGLMFLIVVERRRRKGQIGRS